MSDPQTGGRVLFLTACILGGFGLVVLAASLAARARGRSPRSLIVKYVSWFLVVPPLLLPLVYSRPLFQVVVLLLSLQCILEFARVTGLWADRTLVRLCCLLTALTYVPVFAGWFTVHQAMPAVLLAALVLVPVARGDYEHMLQKVSLSALAVLYFGWFLSHLAYMRNLEHGVAYVFCLLVLTECNDAFAYLWGKSLGRHKLTPRISPNKTVEGAVLAAASVVAVSCLLGFALPDLAVGRAVAVGLVAAVLGTCGDLVVSFIKRDLHVKDMGAAIPGHGGFLDRFDSLILAAPAYFHLVRCWNV
jgi:phosphatidate cytidylyltransferase